MLKCLGHIQLPTCHRMYRSSRPPDAAAHTYQISFSATPEILMFDPQHTQSTRFSNVINFVANREIFVGSIPRQPKVRQNGSCGRSRTMNALSDHLTKFQHNTIKAVDPSALQPSYYHWPLRSLHPDEGLHLADGRVRTGE